MSRIRMIKRDKIEVMFMILIFCVLFFTGCANTIRTFDEIKNPTALSVQADRRIVIVYPNLIGLKRVVNNEEKSGQKPNVNLPEGEVQNIEQKIEKNPSTQTPLQTMLELASTTSGIEKFQHLTFCAEPPPDMFGEYQKALSQALNAAGDVEMSPGAADLATVNANINSALNTTKNISSNLLFRRSQGVQSTRDWHFGLCELFMAGALTYSDVNKHLDKLLTTSTKTIIEELPHLTKAIKYETMLKTETEKTKQEEVKRHKTAIELEIQKQKILNTCVDAKMNESKKDFDDAMSECRKSILRNIQK